MPSQPSRSDRRGFLRFLAASPLIPADLLRREVSPGSLAEWLAQGTLLETTQQGLIRAPGDALSVMDFEAVARANLPPAHFGYMASGVDDDATLRANREGFAHYRLRPRRLVDVRSVDTTVRLLGTTFDSPIVICPCGSQKAFHPDGEMAVARAAKARNHLQLLSGVTTTSVEEVNEGRGQPVWYQLYPTDQERVAQAIARRAQRAGCPVLVLTVDLNGGRNLESQLRAARVDTRDCAECHVPGIAGSVRRKPMFDGLDLSSAKSFEDPAMDWGYVRRLREAVPRMKVVLKGIVTARDASLAVQHGIDAVVVSNHGGRAEESGKASIDSLSEVVRAVGGRIPVLMDGGVRRGTDVFKALSLGATAVGIGRPYLWGLSAFGQAGVEAVLTLLQKELELVMRQMGTTSLSAIRAARAVEPAR